MRCRLCLNHKTNNGGARRLRCMQGPGFRCVWLDKFTARMYYRDTLFFFFFLLVGCFCCVSRSRLAASGSTEGPSSNPTSSQLVSEASAIEDSVQPDRVADICSSQTIKRVCFPFLSSLLQSGAA